MATLNDFKKYVVFGGGQAAKWICSQLKYPERIVGVCDLLTDENRSVKEFLGFKIKRIDEFKPILDEEGTAMIFCVGQIFMTSILMNLLENYGVNKNRLFVPNPYVSVRTFMRIGEHMNDFRIPFSDERYSRVKAMLNDELSLRHFGELTCAIPWENEKSIYDIRWYPDIEDMFFYDENYWNTYDFINPRPEISTVLDCGSYIGDSIEPICKVLNAKEVIWYAFEPLEENASKIRQNAKDFIDEKNLHIMQVGVGEKNATLNFLLEDDYEGGKFVSASSNNTQKLEIRSIDSLKLDIKGRLYVKMDIEGSELEALKGAVCTIKQHRPFMAICLYHRKNDLVEIPLFINEIVDNYNFYLRGGYHTILWAIPKECE